MKFRSRLVCFLMHFWGYYDFRAMDSRQQIVWFYCSKCGVVRELHNGR
jgi:hypothetical protein